MADTLFLFSCSLTVTLVLLLLQSQDTVPLFFKALRQDISPDITQFLHSVQDATELLEKDTVSMPLISSAELGFDGSVTNTALGVKEFMEA